MVMVMIVTMMKQSGWSNSMPGVCSQWILSKVPTPTHSNTLNLIEPHHRHRHCYHYHDYQHHGHWSSKPYGNQTCLKMYLFWFEFLPIESNSWNTAAIQNKCLTNRFAFPLLEISFQLPFLILNGRFCKKRWHFGYSALKMGWEWEGWMPWGEIDNSLNVWEFGVLRFSQICW